MAAATSSSALQCGSLVAQAELLGRLGRAQAEEMLLGVGRTQGNRHAQRIVALQRSSTVAGAEGEGTVDKAAAVAQEVYDALQWTNEPGRVLKALTGLSDGMRAEVKTAFLLNHQTSIEHYLRYQLASAPEPLIYAMSLVRCGNVHGYHTQLAMGLIPDNTRDEDVDRIITLVSSKGAAARTKLRDEYDRTFGDVGLGSLEADLRGDLSGAPLQKALAQIDHDLTPAEQLYLESVAITGVRAETCLKILQSAWDKGPAQFGALVSQWNSRVQGAGLTPMTLRMAMTMELPGVLSNTDWRLARAILDGYDRYVQGLPPVEQETDLWSEDQEAGLESRESTALTSPGEAASAAPTDDEYKERDRILAIEIHVAKDTFAAATAGGGTREDQVLRALETLQKAHEKRIALAREHGSEHLVRFFTADWEYDKAIYLSELGGEEDEGTGTYLRGKLLLLGSLTWADKVWLASEDLDPAKTVEVVTEAWAKGEMAQLLQKASVPRTDENGTIVRPVILWNFVAPGGGTHRDRILALTREGSSDVSRGVQRLKLEIDEGAGEGALQAAYAFLNSEGLSPDIRKRVVALYAKSYLGDPGDPALGFLEHLKKRYGKVKPLFDLADLIDPAKEMAKILERARDRHEAEQTHWLNPMGEIAKKYDEWSGEDHAAVADESLARLEFIAGSTTPAELEGLMAMTGAGDPLQLAALEYGQLQDRLKSLRAVHQAVADAIAMVVETAIAAGISAFTGGAATGLAFRYLLNSLASTAAGMLSRKGMMGDNYQLLSSQNAMAFVQVAAGRGFGALGEKAFNSLVDAERLRQLGKAGSFLKDATIEGTKEVGLQGLAVVSADKLPTTEEILAMAFVIAGKSAGAGGSGMIKHLPPGADVEVANLRTMMAASITQNLTGDLSDELGALAKGGVGNLSPWDIAERMGNRSVNAVGKGLLGGYGDFKGRQVGARQASDTSWRFSSETFEVIVRKMPGGLVTIDLDADGTDVRAILRPERIAASAHDELARIHLVKRLSVLEDDLTERPDDPGLREKVHLLAADLETFVLRRSQPGEPGSRSTPFLTELKERSPWLWDGLVTGNDEAIKQLLITQGSWRDVQMELAMARRHDPAVDKVMVELRTYRARVAGQLAKEFPVKPQDVQTDRPESDLDLWVTGRLAGQKLIEVESVLEARFGPNWSEVLRINLYPEPTRLTRYTTALSGLSPADRVRIEADVTRETNHWSAVKRLLHAQGDAAAELRAKDLARASGVDPDSPQVVELLAMSDSDRRARRNELLAEGDRLDGEYEDNKAGLSAEERARLATTITKKQMEANFYLTEAYVGPGAVMGAAMKKPGSPTPLESQLSRANQAAVANTDFFDGAVRDHSGGNRLQAMREYEPLKYVGRYAEELQQAIALAQQMELGVTFDPTVGNTLPFLKNLGKYVAGTHRRAQSSGGDYVDPKEVFERRAPGAPALTDLPQDWDGADPPVTRAQLEEQLQMYDRAVAEGLRFVTAVNAEMERKAAAGPAPALP